MNSRVVDAFIGSGTVGSKFNLSVPLGLALRNNSSFLRGPKLVSMSTIIRSEMRVETQHLGFGISTQRVRLSFTNTPELRQSATAQWLFVSCVVIRVMMMLVAFIGMLPIHQRSALRDRCVPQRTLKALPWRDTI